MEVCLFNQYPEELICQISSHVPPLITKEIRDECNVYAGRVRGTGVRQYGGGRHIAHSLRTQHILNCINPL